VHAENLRLYRFRTLWVPRILSSFLTWTFAFSRRMLKAIQQEWSGGGKVVVMAGEGSVFRRCGCTDPVTGRQYGTRCPRKVPVAGMGAGMCG
jgi:hypothetical protein